MFSCCGFRDSKTLLRTENTLASFLSPGETFSENFSHTEKCQPCTSCDDPNGLFRMRAPCTDSNDATCVCNYGYFMNEITQRCEPCTVCPLGQGMLFGCEFDHDTVCEECDGDTYSDQESSREPCIPCATCEVDDEILSPCTAVSDTICEGKSVSSRGGKVLLVRKQSEALWMEEASVGA